MKNVEAIYSSPKKKKRKLDEQPTPNIPKKNAFVAFFDEFFKGNNSNYVKNNDNQYDPNWETIVKEFADYIVAHSHCNPGVGQKYAQVYRDVLVYA